MREGRISGFVLDYDKSEERGKLCIKAYEHPSGAFETCLESIEINTPVKIYSGTNKAYIDVEGIGRYRLTHNELEIY